MKNFPLKPAVMRAMRFLPDRAFYSLTHLLYHGNFSTFRNPKTFTELVVCKKLHDRNPLMVQTADKVAVRDFVAHRIGEQYLIPLLQVADRPEDLDFDNLEAPYVIKGRHGYNMTLFVKEGEQPDREAIIAETSKWVKTNFYTRWKEWAYRTCKPGITVERMIGSNGEPPPDFKFYVFNGKVGMIQVDTSRFTGHRSNIFDRHYRSLRREGMFPAIMPPPPAPAQLPQMIELAERLGADFDWVRVDLYCVDGRIYFGEITHYPGGGLVAQQPRELDEAIANLCRNGVPFPEKVYDPRHKVADLREHQRPRQKVSSAN